MKRIVTAIVLIPLVLWIIFQPHFWLLTLAVAVVAELALWEYLGLADRLGVKTPRAAACGALAVIFACTFYRPELLAPVLGCLAFLLLIFCAFNSPIARVLPDTAFTYFGIIYVGLSLSTLPLLSAQENGPSLLLFLFLAVWSGDIAALYVGKLLGRHKLAPTISPGKTWEGAIASLAASAGITFFLLWVARFLSAHAVDQLNYPGSVARWLFLAVLLNAAAQVGDLVESAIKRGAGVKDSGTLLPGHGGILDRIDALLLAAPILWYAQLTQQYF
jgi:phosphatidate cytidylyltransferase